MLLRVPYLALTSVFALVRLLPMSDVDNNVEILALRHQLAVLQRQIDKPRLTPPARVYHTAGDGDNELLAITDSKVVVFGRATRATDAR